MADFRIEIPIDVTTNANMGELQQLENVLNKIYSSFQRDRSAAQGVFDAATSGAGRAAQAIGQVDTAADQAAQAFEDVGDAADEAGSEGQEAAQEAEQAAEQLGDSVGEAADAFDDVGDAAQQAGHESGNAFTQASSNVDKFTRRVTKSERTLRQAFKEKMQLTLVALDKASPALRNITNTVKGLTAKAWHIAVRMTDFVTAPFRRLVQMISSPIALTLSLSGIGLGAGSFINTFSDFASGMSNVRALSGATEEQFLSLTQTAEELGATTKFTAAEASQGMQYLAMAGWDTAEIIDAMPGMLNLAAAGATDLGTAADIVSDVMTAMDMQASEATRASDVFAKTASSTNTTIEKLGATMKYAAPIAHTFGMSLEDVSAAAGLMANAGIKGDMAGTALRASLLRMAKPTDEMQKVMNSLGISFNDNTGKMKSMSQIVKMLETSFSGLTEADKLATAQILFGTEAASAWIGLIGQGSEAYDKLAASLYDAGGAAEEMSKVQLDNLAGDMTILQSAVDGMKISLMKELNPYLRSAVQWLTGKIPDITTKLQGMLKTGLEKAKELKEFVSGVFDSADFQNADGFAGKFFVAWDKIIAEPFQAWWDGGGQQTILGAVGKMGKGLGDLYHGIITGIFAALKGEDIDFEGMNITGISKAGAEAAKTFVEAFKKGFDLGGLWDDSPGLLKAGAIGFGTFKVGGGVLGLVKTISQVKTAFAGTTTMATAAATATDGFGAAAATAAAGTAKAATALTAIKTGLSAIPVWGWLAAAALAAVAVGVIAYNKAQERHQQGLLHAGDDVREAADAYEESARRVVEAQQTIDEIKEVEIRIKENKQQNQNSIQQTKADLAEVQDRIVWLEARLSDTTLTEEDITNYKAQIETIKDRKAEIEAKLASGTLTPEQVTEYQAELDVLEGKEAELNAALAAGTLMAEDVSNYQTELDALKGKEVELKAILAADSLTAEQVSTYASQLAVLQGREEEIKVALASETLTPEQAEEYEKELEIIKTREEKITLKLEGLGLTTAGILLASSLADGIDGKTAEVKVTMGKGSLTKDQINGYTSELSQIYTREAEIELLQAGASLSATEVAEYSTALEGIKNRTAEIEAKIAEGGLTEAEIKALSDEYATLKTQEAAITIMLSGQSLTEEQLSTIAKEYRSLENRRAEITAELSEVGLGIDDLEKVSAALREIGDKQAILNFEFSAGSLKTADLETYNAQLAELYGHLVDLSGGQVTQEDVDAGRVTEERQQQVKETLSTQASTALMQLETELVTKREMIPELLEKRGQYEEQYQADVAVQDRLSQARADLMQLDAERANLAAQDKLLQARAKSEADSYSWDDYIEWYHNVGIPGMQGIRDKYNQNIAGVKDSYGMPAAYRMDGPLDFMWSDDVFSYDLADIQNAEQVAAQQKEANNGDYITYNNQLKGIYEGEVSLTTGKIFEGTELAGQSLQEVAENYATLDETGKKLFEDAVMALNTLNQQTDYIAEGDKTQAMDVVDIVAKAEVMQQVQQQAQAVADSYSSMGESQKAAFAASEEGQAALAKINEALEAIGGQDISSLEEINSALEQLKNADLSSFSLADAQAAFVALGGDATGAKTSVDALKTAIKNLDGTTATTTVTNNVINNTYNNTHTNAAMNANGGIYDGAMLSWVAEDGPEAIIPLGSKRRDRGIDLWLQAGEILGVAEFAEGGIMAPYSGAIAALPDYVLDDEDAPAPIAVQTGNSGGHGQQTIEVSIDSSPTFEIKGGSPDDIMAALKSHMKELAELLGAEFAEQISDIVLNLA